MSVYVDRAEHRFGYMIMCHMVADSLEELHAMADKIGVPQKWFQSRKNPHYDICKSKRKLAVKFGAIEVGHKRMVEVMRRNRQLKSSLVGTAPVICRGCGHEVNPDYGKCRRCG